MTESGLPTGAGLDAGDSNKVAIVGIGDTDYGADYRAARSPDADYVAPDARTLGQRALERALADSGLQASDIDGICATVHYGGPAPEEFAAAVGIKPRHTISAGGMMPFLSGVQAVVSGKCDTIALIHAIPLRTSGRQFGGATYQGDGRSSYYYHHPWGFSSQAAHWAMMFSAYQKQYGATEEDLGAVALALRRNAGRNENAIMRAPLTIDDYLQSRYIVAPLHLFDMCLVNDGAVCLILRRADRARDLPHAAVLVSGWGNVEVHDSKLHYMVKERLRPQMQFAGGQAFRMAGITPADVDHFEGYDASSIHLVNQVEGFGFAAPGEGIELFKAGHFDLGGSLPVNTSGGLLSESYLQGWNLMAEAVRQLRHEAGARQVHDAQTSMFAFVTTDSAHPIIFKRGA